MWDFLADGHTPAPLLCKTFVAWSKLVTAASKLSVSREPFHYDLVNLGRDVLARLSTSISKRFYDAIFPSNGSIPDTNNVVTTGSLYLELLGDLDDLVKTDSAFLLGPWISMARNLAKETSDCNATGIPKITSCEDFYEWNARVQLTTWNPTKEGAARIPDGPIDYAAKHWSGLINDYYKERAIRIKDLALMA